MGTQPIGQTGQQVFKTDELAYGLGNGYITCSIGGTRFIPTSLPIQTGGDLKEYKDNTGVTCSLVVPETFQTISISGYLIKNGSSGGEDIKKGDEVTGLPTVQGMKSGVKWRLQDYSTNWSNEDVAQVTVSVKSYTF
jgi:hypothetical protein